MASFVPPPDYTRIRVVPSLAALLSSGWEGHENAICYPRDLPGDFAAVVAALASRSGVATLDEDELRDLRVAPAGQPAVAAILADLAELRAAGHEPSVDFITEYPRDADRDLPTDVFSFHHDSATVATDTILCTYVGAASEGLRNDEARPRVQDPVLRARLLQRFGGDEGPRFAAWLQEHFHDLHHTPVAGAQPFSFGVGNVWRLAVAYPGAPVPQCVHRAPPVVVGPDGRALPRLLLIS